MPSLEKALSKAATGLAPHINTYFLEVMIEAIAPVDHQRPAASRNLTGSIDCAVDKGALKLFWNLVESITTQTSDKPKNLIKILQENMKKCCAEWSAHEKKLNLKYHGLPIGRFEEKDKAQRETHWRRTALAIALHEVVVMDKKVRQNLWSEYQKWHVEVGGAGRKLYYMAEKKVEPVMKVENVKKAEPTKKSKKRKQDHITVIDETEMDIDTF